VAASLGLALALVGLLSGGESYGGGYPQARAILIEGRGFPLWYPLAKGAGLFVSLISGIPGGLFDPSLSIGAGLGSIFSPFVPGMEKQAFVLLAMGAYFAGVVQSPLTAAIILVEMTAADQMILPLLAATITAYETSRLVCPMALYEALAEAFLRREAPAAAS
jgi:H+/Cl- antiporter ClcA